MIDHIIWDAMVLDQVELLLVNNKVKGFALPFNVAPYKVQIIYNENNKEVAEELYKTLLDNNVSAIIDDRSNLTIGNRINDVYVLGTPKMIVIGNKFDGINFEVEDIKTGEKVSLSREEIFRFFK